MVRPGVHLDEDWEILLLDAVEDDAWEVDGSQRRRIYVGTCAFEKRDPVTERRISFRIFRGRLRMPTPPVRFQVGPRVQSPIRWDSFSGLSPTESDPSEDYVPSEKSESMDSPPVPEHVTVSEEEDVAMTEADMERNADFFLEQVCDEDGMLKEDFFEEAKDSMAKFLRKKRGGSL